MLITVEQLKTHLGIQNDDHDERLNEIVLEASAIVLDYLKRPETDWQTTSGEPDGVPYVVVSATKLVAGALSENREGNDSDPSPLSQTVKDLLHRYRDPALA
jgi:hypothetical protein